MTDDLSPGEREWFALKFRVRHAEAHGQAFQDFFADLMEKAHAGDFVRVRAHGPHGDEKCDGYLASEGRLFQVYATQSQTLGDLLRKISADFPGAREHWGPRMRAWALVHNHGLPPAVVKQLDDLRAAHPDVLIEHWDQERLRSLLDRMARRQLEDLFGRPLEARDFQRLSFTEIAPVVRALEQRLAGADAILDAPIAPVPVAKLQANNVSPTTALLIRLGREGDPTLEDYFARHHDPTLGERVAAGYRAEYARLRHEGWDPDDLFARLVEFTGGAAAESGRAAAVYTILAYFFERCDIYEAAPTAHASSDDPADQAPP